MDDITRTETVELGDSIIEMLRNKRQEVVDAGDEDNPDVIRALALVDAAILLTTSSQDTLTEEMLSRDTDSVITQVFTDSGFSVSQAAMVAVERIKKNAA